MSEPTERLRTLARRLSDSYLAHCRPCAILLVGSAASGDADAYSDLDLLLYYDQTPAEEALAEARQEIGAERFRGTRAPDGSSYGERYYIGGLQCQVGHVTTGGFEREIAKLLVDLELNEELPKIMSGLFEGLPLYGEDLVEGWRREAAYTEPLQRAMIQKHWRFFPWWYFEEKLLARDATVWRYDVLVQSAYNIVGVLAALNRLYFSTFEFKRADKFLARLEVAPPNLAARLDALFDADERASTGELERLVEETQALVAEHFTDIDLSLQWGGTPTPPGSRAKRWA
jgi:Nucleotidyltransferase domain